MKYLVIFIFLLLCGCGVKNDSVCIKSPPEILADLSYDAGGPGRIYIKEDDVPVPYLVLTNHYNGNCLLVREYLLETPRIYNEPGRKSSYYEGSNIDCYLCKNFSSVFSDTLRQQMVDSEIEITAYESIGVGGKDIVKIQRTIFLLSYTELNGSPSRTNPKEGVPLDYFKEIENRIALHEDGTTGSWWLRTASIARTAMVCGVSKEGVVGSSGIYDPNPGGGYFSGVRPAFCLPGDMTLYLFKLEDEDVFMVESPV